MTAQAAVACGHPVTAAAAREVLEDGGNAFDGALAALWASAVVEPVLSSLAGGGFLLARRAGGEAVLYDFFVTTPRHRRPVNDIDFYPILADFGTATQEFHIGLGAMATPGIVKGLFAAHADLANLPMSRLIEPAVRAARQGVPLRAVDAYMFGVVSPILIARPEGRALFNGPDGALLGRDDILRQPELADTIEALAAEGEALFYQGEIGQRLASVSREGGGQIDAEDLKRYRVITRTPLDRRYRDTRILVNPPPCSGGVLIAFALELLAQANLGGLGFGTAEHLALLTRTMTLTNKARVEAHLQEAVAEAEETAAANRLFEPDLLARYAAEVHGRPASPRGTTHISVVDADGNIAALSVSNGEGCGTILDGTGIMLNNMLGEEDLNPQGFHAWPEGSRMTSMMCPTVAYRADGSMAALGSGGSNRIRTAILQVLINLIDFGMPIGEAVEASRLHVEGGVANLEAGFDADAAAAVRAHSERFIPWPRHNMFFGGVHAVTRGQGGDMGAAGDPRREGSALVVGAGT